MKLKKCKQCGEEFEPAKKFQKYCSRYCQQNFWNRRKNFKVTRRIPELSVSETKFFKTKEEAKNQFDYWLS